MITNKHLHFSIVTLGDGKGKTHAAEFVTKDEKICNTECHSFGYGSFGWSFDREVHKIISRKMLPELITCKLCRIKLGLSVTIDSKEQRRIHRLEDALGKLLASLRIPARYGIKYSEAERFGYKVLREKL